MSSIRSARRRDGDAAVHTLVGAYALDALDEEERAAVERHLRRCPDCAVEVDELRAATVRLADTAAHQPPPDLRARVLAAAAHTPQRGPRRAAGPAANPARWPRLVAVAAAVAVLVAGGVATGYGLQQRRVDEVRRQAAAAQQRDAAQRARLDALLEAPDATVTSETLDDGTRIRMIRSAQRDQAAVYLTDLAPAPAGRLYQLWLVTGGTAVSEGVVPAGSRSYTALLTGLRDRTAFAISTEPAPHGSTRPTRPYVSLPLA